MTRKILLVENQPLFASGVVECFRQDAGIKVSAHVSTGVEAMDLLPASQFDAAIVGLSLPDLDGPVVAMRLAQHLPVLVLSGRNPNRYLPVAKAVGAKGFCSKTETATSILEATRAVLDGGEWFKGESDDLQLTDSARRVFERIGRGLTVAEIAEELSLSVNTVKTHQRSLIKTLDVDGASALRILAVSYYSDP